MPPVAADGEKVMVACHIYAELIGAGVGPRPAPPSARAGDKTPSAATVLALARPFSHAR